MRCSFAATYFLLVGLATMGCRHGSESTSAKSPTNQQSQETDLAVLRYHTGDVKEWPDYQFPLEHSFDVPEVPPEIIGPFSADDIPAKE